jgi:hypothetical protein
MSSDSRDELPDRAQTEHAERAAARHIRELHALPCRRQDVAEEQVAIIGQVVADPVCVGVRPTYAKVLRLAAGNGSVQFGVPVEVGAGGGVAVLRGFALSRESSAAHVAFAAGDHERDDHSITDLEYADR